MESSQTVLRWAAVRFQLQLVEISEFREKNGMELYFRRMTLVIGRDATFGK
jgi:hypothetical protein